MSEIESVFDFRMGVFEPPIFREVIVEKPKFHEKKSRKKHIFKFFCVRKSCFPKPPSGNQKLGVMELWSYSGEAMG